MAEDNNHHPTEADYPFGLNPGESEIDEAMLWAAGDDEQLLVHHLALAEVERRYHAPGGTLSVTDYWKYKDDAINHIQARRKELGLPPFPFES